MTDAPATIAAVTALIVAVGGFVLNLLKNRASERASERAAMAAEAAQSAAETSNAKLVEIDGKIYQLTKNVDGKLTKLLDLTREAALAKGRLEGKAEAEAAAAEETDAATNGGRHDGDG